MIGRKTSVTRKMSRFRYIETLHSVSDWNYQHTQHEFQCGVIALQKLFSVHPVEYSVYCHIFSKLQTSYARIFQEIPTSIKLEQNVLFEGKQIAFIVCSPSFSSIRFQCGKYHLWYVSFRRIFVQ